MTMFSDSVFSKRTYLPFTITATCPACGVETEQNLDEDYLSYPLLSVDEEVGFYCECEHEWDVTIKLNLDIVAVDGCTVRRNGS